MGIVLADDKVVSPFIVFSSSEPVDNSGRNSDCPQHNGLGGSEVLTMSGSSIEQEISQRVRSTSGGISETVGKIVFKESFYPQSRRDRASWIKINSPGELFDPGIQFFWLLQIKLSDLGRERRIQ